MEHQLHFEMPVNPDTLKVPTSKAIFPITRFHHFHKNANINYQLNRFLIYGLEEVFTQIGHQIENFDDWKRLFFAKASSYEEEGRMDYAMALYRAVEFFISPQDPDKMFAYEKFISLFYRGREGHNVVQIKVPYSSGHLHGFRFTPFSPGEGTIIIHGGFDSYSEELYSLGMSFCETGYEVIIFDGPDKASL